MRRDRRKYLISFLRGCASAADEGQLHVDLGKLLINGQLMREAADEFEKVVQETTIMTGSSEWPAQWNVTLHATMDTLKNCGLSIHQCEICCALVVEDSVPMHMEFHEKEREKGSNE